MVNNEDFEELKITTKFSDKISFSKSLFVNISDSKLSEHYTIMKEIGEGAYGRVFRVKHKVTNNFFACKRIEKDQIENMEVFNREVDLLIQMDHPNIIKLYEVFIDKTFVYLIMEECQGGELLDRLISKMENKVSFTEEEVKRIFFQVMSAVCYCHKFKICHRDLKPENILFLNKSDDSPLKIIDFGLSKLYKDNGGKRLIMHR